jgi:F0F1-type ATP synthase membrane subunit c/vacuolar-type H+-ATPase subunit K
MLILSSFKVLVFGFAMFPISFSALGVGILFAAFNLAVSRNPEERDSLFSTTMMAFALIESFVFIGILVAVAVFFVL